MLAHDGPGDPGVAVGVAAVELITIIEADGTLVRDGTRRTPFQDFLGPVHAHVIVHPAGKDHFLLSGVPKNVVSFCMLQLVLTVKNGAAVTRVLGKRAVRPGLPASQES